MVKQRGIFARSIIIRIDQTICIGEYGETSLTRKPAFRGGGVGGEAGSPVVWPTGARYEADAVRCVVWDFDGTLAYRKGVWSGAMLDLLAKAAPSPEFGVEDLRPHLRTGFPWHTPESAHPDLDTSEKWWDALSPVFERAYLAAGVEPELARKLSPRVREAYLNPDKWRVYDDVFPTLDGLSSRGWTHLVLSNHVPELSDIAEHLRLENRICRIFNSAKTGHEKPHPEAYQGVLEVLGETEAVWMVGDSMEEDVIGAEAAGIPSVLVRRPHPGASRYSEDLLGAMAFIEGGR